MSPRKRPEPGTYYDAKRDLWIWETVHGVTDTGKPRRVRRTARKYDDLVSKIREAQRTFHDGLPVVNRRMTVREWCEHYAAEILPYGPAAKSAGQTAYKLTRYVYPHRIATRPLVDLEPVDVRRWLRTLEQLDAAHGPKRKLAPDTVARARQALSGALTAAVREQVATRNVVQLTSPPRGSGKRRIGDALTVEQVEAVLACSAAGIPDRAGLRPDAPAKGLRPDRFYALAEVVLTLGIRQSEALDLRWCDVDLDLGVMRVYVDDDDDRDDLAKTRASSRTIPIPDGVVDALKRHRAEQRVERFAADAWADNDLVFASTIGTRVNGRNALRWWHALTTRAGVGRRRFHASRHTAAVVMRNRNVPLADISAILGHASLQITDAFYARPDVEQLRGAANAADRAYRRRRLA